MSLVVSVDVKQLLTMLRHWSQFVTNMSTNIRGYEALHHHHHRPAKVGLHVLDVGRGQTLYLCDERPVVHCVFVRNNFIFGFSFNGCNPCKFTPAQIDHFVAESECCGGKIRQRRCLGRRSHHFFDESSPGHRSEVEDEHDLTVSFLPSWFSEIFFPELLSA